MMRALVKFQQYKIVYVIRGTRAACTTEQNCEAGTGNGERNTICSTAVCILAICIT